MIHNRPRDRQHGDINPDPPATATLRHAIIRNLYGLVPFFGYRTPKACLGVRRTNLTTKQKPRRNRMRSRRNSILRRQFTFQRRSQPQFTEFVQHEIRRRRMNLTKRLPRAFFGMETFPIDQNNNIALVIFCDMHQSIHPTKWTSTRGQPLLPCVHKYHWTTGCKPQQNDGLL